MSSLTTSPASLAALAALRRFSVSEYHQMIQAGILDEDDQVELLDGYVVHKMARNPPHDTALQLVRKRIERLLPTGWDLRIQSAVTLPGSEPEPDVAVVRGDERSYSGRHPGPGDIGLLVEVSDATLLRDRDDKGPIYARAGIVTYWIVNLVDREVEVFSNPGASSGSGYATQQVFRPGSSVALVIDAAVVGFIPVQELLP